jgi:predicted dehydrogenase
MIIHMLNLPVRVAVMGIGNMGSSHARLISDGGVPGAVLTAVCDTEPARLAAFPEVEAFGDPSALLSSDVADAVIIATPHLDHASLGVAALDAGLHVLVEKPLAVDVADARRLVDAHERHPDQVFAFMVNQRTDPRYRLLKQLIEDGELGAIHRISWTITDWFRTDAYYTSSSWRATWAGEGGGVLVNQCPHQMDLWCWLFGRPDRVRGHCQVGRWHDLEVEDACTAYLEYVDGPTGVFITSTGEAPGTNRLEIATDRGRVVVEDDLCWTKTATGVIKHLRNAAGPFETPATEEIVYRFDGWGGQHAEILANFIEAITEQAPLIGPGADGLAAVELTNAILMSSIWDRTLTLPLDAAAVQLEYQRLAAGSRPRSIAGSTAVIDLTGSFGKR